MDNQFRVWLNDQPRTLTQAKIADEIGVDRSYVSDLANPGNTIMPSLPVAVKIMHLTKGRVRPEDIYDSVQANRAKEADDGAGSQ